MIPKNKGIKDMIWGTCFSNIPKNTYILAMITLSILIFSGCLQPDQRTYFQPDYQHALDAELKKTDPNQRLFQIPKTQQSLELSIEQSVIFALQNNKELQIQQLQPMISGTFEQIERGIYDPEIFTNVSFFKNREEDLTTENPDEQVTEESDLGLSLGIRQSLPFGTTVEMALEKDRNRVDNEHKARLGLTITQSLLQGYGTRVNLANIKIAEMNTIASQYEIQEFAQNLVADTEIAYWEYALAQQKSSIFEKSLKIATQQRDEIKQQISMGVLPKNEAAAAYAEVALREQALIEANNLLENRRLKLLRFISVNQFDLQIKPISQPDIQAKPVLNVIERISLAEKMRPDLNEAHLRLKQKRLETIVTRNGVLPKLDLFLVLGRTGYAKSFSEAFQNMNQSTYDVRVGMQLEYLLGNRAARSRKDHVLLKRQQAIKAIANHKQIVHYDVRLAINEIEHARKQIAATRVTLMYQKQTAKAEKARFAVGASTALMVSQAYRDLLAARNAEIEAIINYRIALIQLYVAEGSLLERRGLKVIGTR
jgi:outer membrane protein TolC